MGAVLAILILIVGGFIGFIFAVSAPYVTTIIWFLTILGAVYTAYAVRIADQWEKHVVLRLGKYDGLRGPGIFFLVPVLDKVPYVIDLRTQVSTFDAKQTLTKDNVPVDVDAILFWKVIDAEKAALEVTDYWLAVNQASQTGLRDIIGQTELSQMLAGRDSIGSNLKTLIDTRTDSWGIDVSSVEIKDVIIPANLQDAMSRQAQAERERQARVILGDSENQIAEKFAEAAKKYEGHPAAMHLRGMNMLYEGMKDKGALIIVPSSAVESMNLGSIAGLAAIDKENKRDQK